ncbi:AlkA N-terminal domain-containing protein [Anaerocolumna sp. AGMB13025]|uniref:AlkA N-terminal domain-containing protein n=1 Tax=Anaerocolumna sp. AGMB13025 TaxID=3039116 RepID=UPI00241BF3C8|nr:AlkA N-terminal domain-containing protein [Anaerocolumna sp. AGMB13025]WFR55714.1 AlkA N-terminal domain-containing protein [Anaerocolumna sp. AGMB13025]
MRKEHHSADLDRTACYAALKAHDPRFDGRFFTGVSSTGIYCRPICRVKLPKEENCTFFMSAPAAEAAGYRPCRRCRPELAPGLSLVDSTSYLAQKAAMIMEENCLADMKIADLAAMLDVTDRHLRRAFTERFGVSPVQYLQTRRLLLAKCLLADTGLSITKVALYSGFGSIRRFNDLFKKYYRAAPTAFRKSEKAMTENKETITLTLGYRPPYAWDELIEFLAGRAITGVELVKDGIYSRTVAVHNGKELYCGWISVENKPKNNSLSITMCAALLPVLTKILARLRRLFDLNCDPIEIYKKLSVLDELTPGLCVPGLRLPGCFDPFEISVRAVLGQQVTVKAARTLAMRFAHAFGGTITTPFEELQYTFPTSETILSLKPPIENNLGPLGITGARGRSIYALAEAIETGSIHFTSDADPKVQMEKLLKLPGFGPWTVQYIGMRAFSWPDAFPHTDYGVKKALSNLTEKEILEKSQEWKPWRSYAVMNLWNSLKENKMNQEVSKK